MSLGLRVRSAGTTWYLQVREDGSCDVLKRGREVLSGAPYSKASTYLRRNRSKGDKAWLVDTDGYRTRI